MARQPHRDLPTLNLLRTFEAAGQHLSFKLAADTLCVTPSAVSQQIQLLESQLGIRLFERLNRALRFTPAGEEYWQKVHKQLNQLRQATDALCRQHGTRRLRVSVMPPVAQRIIFPQLQQFRDQYPELELHIETGLAYTDLRQGKADLAIRFGTPPWDDMRYEKLLDVSVQLVCPPGFTDRYQLLHKPTAVCHIPRIAMTGRPESWQQWFRQSGLCPDSGTDASVFYVDDYPAAIQAAETQGAALALYPIENSLIRAGRLESPFAPSPPLTEAIYAVWPPHLSDEPLVRAFIDWVRCELQAL